MDESLKETFEQILIPKVQEMLTLEKKHLTYLQENNAPIEFIERSNLLVIHLEARILEYFRYADGL